MAREIRINGDDLEYKSSTDVVQVLTGTLSGGTGTARALRYNASNGYLEYIDASGNIRVLGRSFFSSASETPRSIRVIGSNLEYVDNNGDRYVVTDGGSPPSAPTNLSITYPSDGDQLSPQPWDAEATWDHPGGTADEINVQWLRDGIQVQFATITNMSTTVHVSDDEYWSEGDDITCKVRYNNAYGNGDWAEVTEVIPSN